MKNAFAYSKQLITRLGRDDMTSYAAALAYKFLFALFPLILFLTALLAFLHLPRTIPNMIGPLSNLMPKAVVKLLENNITQAVQHENPTVLSLGILGFIWGMTGAFMELMDAFNHAYELSYPFKRTVWQRYALGIGTGLVFGMLFVTLLLLATGGTLITHWLLDHVLHLPLDKVASSLVHWLLLLAMLIISLDILYAILPDVPIPFRLFSPGTILATVVFILLSLGFSLYTSHFHSYNKMYGSLGAVILLLLYLYLLSLAILLGVEMNALSHHHEKKAKAQTTPLVTKSESKKPK